LCTLRLLSLASRVHSDHSGGRLLCTPLITALAGGVHIDLSQPEL
jgi:hypothetical protein